MKLIRNAPHRKHLVIREKRLRAPHGSMDAAPRERADKPDPYATPLHRSVDLILLIVAVLIFAFVWSSSARGEMLLRSAPDTHLTQQLSSTSESL